jgi:hypothetical protein
MKNRFARGLIISDCHFPYNHPDTIPFLTALQNKYDFDQVFNIGDEVDYHAISFHPSDPDLFSPGHELEQAINRMQCLYKLFPKCDVLESNHGSLVYRKQKVAGLPRAAFKSYRDTLQAPKGWTWHEDIICDLPNGNPLYLCHGKTSDAMRHSRSMGMSLCIGHHHERFEIRYWTAGKQLHFSMIVGCLIDNTSEAFRYNKLFLQKPIIGVGAIIDSVPRLFPMILDEKGRWGKKIL